jgi:hypothetical protein
MPLTLTRTRVSGDVAHVVRVTPVLGNGLKVSPLRPFRPACDAACRSCVPSSQSAALGGARHQREWPAPLKVVARRRLSVVIGMSGFLLPEVRAQLALLGNGIAKPRDGIVAAAPCCVHADPIRTCPSRKPMLAPSRRAGGDGRASRWSSSCPESCFSSLSVRSNPLVADAIRSPNDQALTVAMTPRRGPE